MDRPGRVQNLVNSDNPNTFQLLRISFAINKGGGRYQLIDKERINGLVCRLVSAGAPTMTAAVRSLEY